MSDIAINTHPKLSWKGNALIYLVLPAFILACLSFHAWTLYVEHEQILEVEKAKAPEERTRLAAKILDEMVRQIQNEVDRAAEIVSKKDIQTVNAKLSEELSTLARKVNSFSIRCDKNIQCDPLYDSMTLVKEDDDITKLNSNRERELLVERVKRITSSEKKQGSEASVPTLYSTHIYGSAIALALPNESDEVTLWSTYYARSGHFQKPSDLGTGYTKNKKENDWFNRPMSSTYSRLKSLWVEPYPDEAGRTYMITYSSPILRSSDKKIIGVVTADLSINQLESIIQHLITDISVNELGLIFEKLTTGVSSKQLGLIMENLTEDVPSAQLKTIVQKMTPDMSPRESKKIVKELQQSISVAELEFFIQRLMSGLNGVDGFGALTYGDGTYVYHPQEQYVKNGESLKSVARKKNDADREEAARLAKMGQSGTISHISTTTKEESWYIVEPIKSSGWSLQNTFFKGSFYNKADLDKRRLNEVYLYTCAMLLLCWILALFINMIGWSVPLVWLLSTVASILLVAGIANTWGLALNVTKPKNNSDHVIDSVQAVEYRVKQYLKKPYAEERINIAVPTGIYVETIELKDANVVNMSGRIWQVHHNQCKQDCSAEPCKDVADELNDIVKRADKFSPKLVKGESCQSQCIKVCDYNHKKRADIGVQFGDAKNEKFTSLPMTVNENGDTIASWWFQADVAAKFDYSRYPLEIEYLKLDVQSRSDSGGVVLVPDVESYKFGSNRKPGLSENIFVPGWEVFRSYFTLELSENSEPTYGMAKSFDNNQFYDLYFNVGLKRIFLDAFISNLTPLIVVAIILFAVALLPNSIDISRILGICVSVFFVIVFSHLSIRRNISANEIFYLEYFFIWIYIALLLVPVDAFRETLGLRMPLFEYRNGLVYKVLYWPSLLGLFYFSTVAKFI